MKNGASSQRLLNTQRSTVASNLFAIDRIRLVLIRANGRRPATILHRPLRP
jgi:hypothetical protein